MRLKEKIKVVPQKLFTVLKAYPIELLLCIYCFTTLALNKEKIISEPSYLILVPIFITIAYVLNNFLISGKWHNIYYLSWFPLLPLSFIGNWNKWIDSSQCVITIAILCPIVILLCRKAFENRLFVNDIINYFYSFCISALMALITWGLFLATFYSVVYIFNIDNHRFVSSVFEYSWLIAFILLFPLLLFTFIRDSFKSAWKGTRVFDILLNYIVTPALLIYTIILYTYITKILIFWELPKGGIAYLVFGFTIFAIIVKALQMFILEKRYNWFFDHFSFISLPTLAMFWVGVVKRVGEYGLTDWRVYLIVCGIIMTLCLLMFIGKRGRYACVAVLSFILFCVMAYFPYLSAEDISIRSQEQRVYKLALQLGILNTDGHIITERRPQSDTLYRKEYRKLYSSLKYLEQNDKLQNMGLNSKNDLSKIIPQEIEDYVLHGQQSGNNDTRYIRIIDLKGGDIKNISDYKKMYIPALYFGKDWNADVYSRYTEGTLKIFNGQNELFSIEGIVFLESQLQKAGYSLAQLPAENTLNLIAPQLLLYRTDSVLVKFSSINLESGKKGIEITDMKVNFILTK